MDTEFHDIVPRYYRLGTDVPFGALLSGGIARHKNGLPAWRALPHYVLVYALAGHAEYSDANGNARRVGPGDALILFPGVRHTYPAIRGDGLTQLWINFRGPVFDLLKAEGILDPSRPIAHVEPLGYWFRRMEDALGAVREPAPGQALTQVMRLLALLADIRLHESARDPGEQERQWLARAQQLIGSEGLARRPNWRAIARELRASYESFRKRFRRLSGMAPARYWMTRRIEMACQMMIHQNMTNYELASECGFHDEYHFSRRFKQVAGMTPTQFRNQLGWGAPPGS